MWSGLWGMVGKCVMKDSADAESGLFEPPINQPDFAFAEEHGLWCEVVSWEGVRDHPDVFTQLMRSENFDASSALAEDEMSLLDEIQQKMSQKLKKKAGERDYDTLLRVMLELPGQAFGEKDIQCRYNLAKVIGRTHLDFAIGFVGVYVDFKKITVSNKCIQNLTLLPAKTPWLKICLLLDNYMTESPQTTVGSKGLADNWSKDTIVQMVQDFPLTEFEAMEENVCKMINAYSACSMPSVPPELAHKTQCRLAYRAGAVLRGKKRKDWKVQLSMIEQNLRKKLPPFNLPPPILEAPRPEGATSDTAAGSQNKMIDEIPALNFDAEGGVLTEEVSFLARSKGLAIGSECVLTRNVRGIKRNCVGTILSFGRKEPHVKIDATDDQEQVSLNLPLASISLYKRPPASKIPKATNADNEAKKPIGIEWQPFDNETVEKNLLHVLLAMNAQLAIQKGPTHEEVCVLQDPRVLVAQMELPPLALKLVPRAVVLERLEAGADELTIDVAIDMPGLERVRYKRMVVDPNFGHQRGSALIIDLVEFVLATSEAARAYDGGFVELVSVQSGQLHFGLCPYTTDDENLKPNKKTPASVSASFRYYTNKAIIPMGSALAITRCNDA
jgi:hypothetical protein